MKILILTPYVYEPKYKEFAKNNSGFGIMVNNIYNEFNKSEDTYIISHALTKGRGKYIKHSISSILFSASIKDYFAAAKLFFATHLPLVDRLRISFYRLNQGFIRNTLIKINPDIVQIHGMVCGSIDYIDACIKTNTKFVVTLHGLIKDDPDSNYLDISLEKKYLKIINDKEIPITVISTGIKNKLITNHYYSLKNINCIYVVPNGIEITKTEPQNSIKKLLHIPKSANVILTVGTVCENKNQIQVINAYNKLPLNIRNNTWLIIVGLIKESFSNQNNIKSIESNKNIIFTGFVNHSQLADYYSEANLTVLASKNEGFGLSLTESFVYGVPCLTFSDLDAISDIYHEKAMVICDVRNDQEFSKSMQLAIEKIWDHQFIKEYSSKFSLENMKNLYIAIFKKIINE